MKHYPAMWWWLGWQGWITAFELDGEHRKYYSGWRDVMGIGLIPQILGTIRRR